MSIYLLAILWFLAVVIILLAMNGWLINFIYAFRTIVGALLDVACQAWIDVSKLWARKRRADIELDEYERHLS